MIISQDSVAGALREEDIEGLIELGAPADEYAYEAIEITASFQELSDVQTVDSIAAVIISIWKKSFNLSDKDMEFRMLAIRKVAQRLLE